ncbi:unnamed protein product [Angiostrongylus costaricensis]|uniref:Uncharacterized protein n=1 Tax=Angiostrongylus costaricensis TaxID=334426 RepID=A0A0R3PWQ9_ANGCS|nr:unnamed protein product [Angiostrongylus costaricensis]
MSTDYRRSLSGLAQFILPALIDSSSMTDVRGTSDHEGLLEGAHRQIMRAAVGLKEMAERAHEAGRRRVEKFQREPPLCFIIMNRAYHKYGLKRITHNRSRHVVKLMARVFNNSEYLVYIKGRTTLQLQKVFNK